MGKDKRNRRGTENTYFINEQDVATVAKHMAVRLGNDIVVFGGRLKKSQYMASAPMDEIYLYNIHREQWTKHVISKSDHAVPHGTEAACTVLIGTDIYMHGGNTWRRKKYKHSTCCKSDALWKLSKRKYNDFTWQKIHFHEKKAIPSPRVYHSGWEHDKKLFTFGGCSVSPQGYLSTYGDFEEADFNLLSGDEGNDYYCNQLNYFNPQCKKWTNIECTGAAPTPRHDFGCTKINHSVYIHGGLDTIIDFQYLDDFYVLNMSTVTWVQLADAPMDRIAHSLTAVTDSQIVLHAGGTLDKDHKDTWILDLHTLKWKEVTRKEHTERFDHTATMAGDGHIVIIGGTEKNNFNVCHIHLIYQPKTLEQLALCCVNKHKKRLTPKQFQMPHNTHAGLFNPGKAKEEWQVLKEKFKAIKKKGRF